MALLLAESFEWPTTTDDLVLKPYQNKNSAKITFDSTGGPDGDGALKFDNADSAEQFVMPFYQHPTTSIYRVLFWIKTTAGYVGTDGSNGVRALVRFSNEGTTEHGTVGLNSAGKIAVYEFYISGSGVDLRATSTQAVNDGEWHQVELELKYVSGSTGVAKIWIDRVLDTNVTGDMRDSGDEHSPAVVYLGAGRSTGAGAATGVWFKHVIVWDDTGSDFVGSFGGKQVKVKLGSPLTDGDVSGFTPSASTNVSNVDELPPDDDTTYNSSSTSTNQDLFNFDELGEEIDEVNAVVMHTYCRLDTAAAQQVMKNIVKINGTVYKSAEIPVARTDYAFRRSEFILNPDTALAWDRVDFNGAQFGYELV